MLFSLALIAIITPGIIIIIIGGGGYYNFFMACYVYSEQRIFLHDLLRLQRKHYHLDYTEIIITPLFGRSSTQRAPRYTLVYQIYDSFLRRF